MKFKLASLSFLIPAYKDEDTIEQAVMEASDIGNKVARRFEILVINDHSPDKTGEKLKKLQSSVFGLTVSHHATNKGYGSTIKELYRKGKSEWLFTIPGDYQIGAKEILKLLPYINNYDMIIGWRRLRQDPKDRLRQSRIYNLLVQNLFKVKVHDVNSVRLMRSSIIKKICLTTSSAFVDAELIIRSQKAGFRIYETVISHRKRQHSEDSAGGGKLKTIMPTIQEMIRFLVLGK